MKKIFISLFFICLAVANTQKINKNILQTQEELKEKKQKIKLANLSLEELGKSIMKQQNGLKKLSKKISKLNNSINKTHKKIKKNEKRYIETKRKKEEAIYKKQKIERELVDIIVKDLGFSQVMSSSGEAIDTDDIISQEILKSLSKIVLQKSSTLKNEFLIYKKKIKAIELELNALKQTIKKLEKLKKNVMLLKKKEQKYLDTLNVEKTIYKKKIKRLMSSQKDSRLLLSKLKVTKKRALKKEQQRRTKEQKKRLALKKAQDNKKQDFSDTSKLKVRQIGSSYQKIKNIHYKGKKVKAPIENFKITKRFGTYFDPVYDLKIHNDSVTLKSNKKNVIVRNVMSGKVIFAKNFNMLGNTVIIKHKNNMHTIYSNLSKIAPNITKGKKIRSRTAIGRIESELKFEVTKEEIPINPLELIKS